MRKCVRMSSIDHAVFEADPFPRQCSPNRKHPSLTHTHPWRSGAMWQALTNCYIYVLICQPPTHPGSAATAGGAEPCLSHTKHPGLRRWCQMLWEVTRCREETYRPPFCSLVVVGGVAGLWNSERNQLHTTGKKIVQGYSRLPGHTLSTRQRWFRHLWEMQTATTGLGSSDQRNHPSTASINQPRWAMLCPASHCLTFLCILKESQMLISLRLII